MTPPKTDDVRRWERSEIYTAFVDGLGEPFVFVSASAYDTIKAERDAALAEVAELKQKAELNWDKWNYTSLEEEIAASLEREAKLVLHMKRVIDEVETWLYRYEQDAGFEGVPSMRVMRNETRGRLSKAREAIAAHEEETK